MRRRYTNKKGKDFVESPKSPREAKCRKAATTTGLGREAGVPKEKAEGNKMIKKIEFFIIIIPPLPLLPSLSTEIVKKVIGGV